MVNGRPAPSVVARGGAPKWIIAGETLIYLRMQDEVLGTVDVVTAETAQIVPARGCTELAAGSGVYAAWDGRYGLFGNDVPLERPATAGLADVARDGTLAYAPDRNQYGVALWPSGVLLLSANASTFRLADAQHGVWVDGGQLHYYGVTDPGIQQATPVAVAVLVMVGNEPWVVYSTNGGVLARPVDSPLGYVVVPTPTAFNHDAVWLPHLNRLRVGSCMGQAELPTELEIHDLDLSLPRIDVTQFGKMAPEPKPERPALFDMRRWFYGTPDRWPRWDGATVYDTIVGLYADLGVSMIVAKHFNPHKATYFYERDGFICLGLDYTNPEQVLRGGSGMTHMPLFPLTWDLAPIRVEADQNTEIVWDAFGHVISERGWPYEIHGEYLPAYDFGGEIGTVPALKITRDSRPFTGNPNDWEEWILTDRWGSTAFRDPRGYVVWNLRTSATWTPPAPRLPFPPRASTPAPKPEDHLATKRMKVSLQTLSGQYVVAEGGGGSDVNANRERRGPWEEFILTVLEENVPEPHPPTPGPDPNPR